VLQLRKADVSRVCQSVLRPQCLTTASLPERVGWWHKTINKAELKNQLKNKRADPPYDLTYERVSAILVSTRKRRLTWSVAERSPLSRRGKKGTGGD